MGVCLLCAQLINTEMPAELQGNIEWARMEIKPSKYRRISIVKGQLTNERFYVNNEPIPTIQRLPSETGI